MKMQFDFPDIVYYSLLVNPDKQEYGRIQMILWRRKFFRRSKIGSIITIPNNKSRFKVLSITTGSEPWSDGDTRSFININIEPFSRSERLYFFTKLYLTNLCR